MQLILSYVLKSAQVDWCTGVHNLQLCFLVPFAPVLSRYIGSTRNSSGDEIANVNFLYDDIVHAVKIQ